jgi:hypothetical protein
VNEQRDKDTEREKRVLSDKKIGRRAFRQKNTLIRLKDRE